MMVAFRLLGVAVDEKARALRTAVHERSSLAYRVDSDALTAIPGSPFAYWVNDQVRNAFSMFAPFESEGRCAYGGMKTQADIRFLRLWWEPATTGWAPLCKGGQYAQFYSDPHLVTDWWLGGIRPRAAYESKAAGESWGGFGRNESQYFRPGLTWSRRSQRGLGIRAMPSGCIFGDKGPALLVEGNRGQDILAVLSIVSSAPFRYLVGLQMAFGSFEVGVIQRTPFPPASPEQRFALAALAKRGWSAGRSLDTVNETSHAFVLPHGSGVPWHCLDVDSVMRELAFVQMEVDKCAFDIYRFDEAARRAMAFESNDLLASIEAEAGHDEDDSDGKGHASASAEEAVLSWMVGCAFGRFDYRLATGERKPPPEPEPFDPLPTRSPGMWPEGEPRDVAPPPILVDEPHHKLDLVAHMLAVAEKVKVEPPASMRAWLAKEFFPLHIKIYSKSRRKAPIYWQLATPSASYSVWLYIHAFTKDTMFHVEELVNDKVLLDERKANELRNDVGESPSAAARKAIAAQDAFLEELRGMAEEVRRVKPLWKPDLDDGVVINFAPLWRLVPHHKPWQKELRETWAALCVGEYDWSHLAMHLWPERVVPKCATDRSFAIAHGLEDVFWLEDANGKWKPRATPTRPVADLIAERTSAAVTAARDSLIAAPTPCGGGASKKKRAAPKARRPRR